MTNCHTSLLLGQKYIEDGYFEGDDYFEVENQTAEELSREYEYRHKMFFPDIIHSSGADALFDTDLADVVGVVARVAGVVRCILNEDVSPVDLFLRVGRPLKVSVKQILSAGTTATGITTLHYP